MKKKLLFIALLFVSISLNAQLWSSQTTNFPTAVTAVDQISIVDSNIVWIDGFLGDGSGLHVRASARTNDGGTTWIAGSYTGMTGTVYPQVLAAVSYNSAFCIAYDTASSIASFWKTTDGGNNWATVTGVLNTGSTTFADGVMFWDTLKGFCYGDPVSNKFDIYNTTDGGTTWNSIPTGSISAPLSGEYGYNGADCACKIYGGIAMFITNKGRVYRTTDYGATWMVTVTAPGTTNAGAKIYASSANYIIVASIATTTATVWDWKYTTDGGATWNTYAPTGNFYDYAMCYVPYSSTMFVSTSPSTTTTMGVSYSNDSGLSWTDFTDLLLQPTTGTNIQCLGVSFYSPQIGWVGYYGTVNSILKYYNPSSTVGIPQAETISVNDVNVYPNPANDIVTFNINSKNKADYTIKLIDVTGKTVFEKVMNANSITTTTFDCSSLTKGIYIVNVTTQNNSINKKLMIK